MNLCTLPPQTHLYHIFYLQPTKLISPSEILIDNILSNVISHEVISGNTTATISDHQP